VNKLTKVGLSALCGSLAAVSSANAGAMTVSGSATATYQSTAGAVTGNPIGMNSGLTFTGSGELDGGQTFKYTITNADQAAFSAGSMSLTTNMLGTWRVGAADGASGIDSKDDVMPTAWEEVDGTGMLVGQDKISGVGASMNIGWKSPKVLGSNLSLAYAPQNAGGAVNDKSSTGSTSRYQYGYDVLLDMNVDNAFYMPNVFVGGSVTHQEGDFATGGIKVVQFDDKVEAVAGFVWKIGPLSAGLQRSYENPGLRTAGSTEYYANTAYGVSFNVNDSLSLSYAEHWSHRSLLRPESNEAVRSEATSIQVAYTIGGVALKLAESDVSNAQYLTSAGSDLETRTVAMSLAF
jgi:hypothetical protein